MLTPSLSICENDFRIERFSLPNARAICKFNHILIAPTPWFRFSSAVPKLRAFLKFWLPVLFWMTLIFSASADSHSYEHSSRFVEPFLRWLFPQMSQNNIEEIHHLIRKCGHLTEYAILALLVWRALHLSKNNLPTWSWPKVGGTLLIVFLYAASDEFHQRFVPTRTALVSDVFIDTAGGAIGLLALWIFGRWRKHR
jgi:VanZ family protein